MLIISDDQNHFGKEKSLAEIFQQKKKDLADKLNSQRNAIVPNRNGQEKENNEYSKEELWKRRKQFKVPIPVRQAKANESDSQFPAEMNKSMLYGESKGDLKSKAIPPQHLLERLARGIKPKVSKKEMIALTTRMYDNLPEIKKKKEEEKKRDDTKKRIEKVKELNKVLNYI